MSPCRKQVKLISPAYLPELYNHKNCFSQVDLEAIDFERYPLFRGVQVQEFTLQPGDVLFIPVGWWHHVRALDVTITISFTNFRAHNDFQSFYETYGDI